MTFVTLRSVSKSFGPSTVVRDFDLNLNEGEFLSLLGPSGCGKTTVLRMVAGFESPSAGRIEIGGQDVTRLRPNQRKIGMMFQAYALFPNLTVAGNVAFGLKVAGLPRAQIAGRVEEMLAMVGLGGMGGRYPFQLSGGQQQRVALARAIAPRPRVLLLDEPLSALDAKIRVSLRNEIRAIQKELGITTIFVTHDQEEALSLSDRIVVMQGGRAEQIGTPFEIYSRPTTKFVANFVGMLNTLDAEVTDPTTGRIRIGGTETSLRRPLPAGKVTLAARPEMIALGLQPGRDTVLEGRITSVDFLGSVIRLRARVDGSELAFDTFNSTDAPPPAPGTDVKLSLLASDLLLLDDK